MDYILKMENITKTFPGVKALDAVSINVRSGRVHAVIGENGAGKSTLMKVLTGINKPDSGVITFKGEIVKPQNPKEMSERGISIIHQEFNLLPDLTVAENIYVTREPRKLGNLIIDDKKMVKDARLLLDSLGLTIDAGAIVENLSVAEKQMVEIAKALVVDSDILVLDEPTSALAESEVQKLFEIIRDLRSKGVAIVYISHRLEEFDHIVDEVTVLRDGVHVSTREWSETTIENMICEMVGRNLDEQYPKRNHDIGDVILSAENINRGRKVRDISMDVRSGEIVGIAGLMGAGRSEFARAIFGADKISSGTIKINGKTISSKSPNAAIKNGIAYLTEDRKSDGLFLDLEVDTNILAGNLHQDTLLGVINDGKLTDKVSDIIRQLNIKTPSSKQICNNLSGGNQQKVLIGRWLMKDAHVYIFDEPTRGIDVGAKFEVYTLMNALAEAGAAIIMISSELSEVLGMSDRIYVLCEGELMGEMNQIEATQENIMHLASGLKEKEVLSHG